MSKLAKIAAGLLLVLLTGTMAMALEPMQVTARIFSGNLYDYVVLGEHPRATEGYDNAYDTISPGNLNADMGEPYISAVIVHPEWKPAYRTLRGDVRPLAAREQWVVTVSSSLPAGTPLKVVCEPERIFPHQSIKLTGRVGGGGEAPLFGEFSFPAPGPGKTVELTINAVQQ